MTEPTLRELSDETVERECRRLDEQSSDSIVSRATARHFYALGLAARDGPPREPTKAMLNAAHHPRINGPHSWGAVWQVMWDEWAKTAPTLPRICTCGQPLYASPALPPNDDAEQAAVARATPREEPDQLEARLRGEAYAWDCHPPPFGPKVAVILREAADALAAQAKTIAERESRMLEMHSEIDLTHEKLERAERDARLLRVCVNAADAADKWENMDRARLPVWWYAYRTARAQVTLPEQGGT